MRVFCLIIIISIACFSCGKKDDPEYKSYYYKKNTVEII